MACKLRYSTSFSELIILRTGGQRSMGGNVHRILLKNEPMFTLNYKKKTHTTKVRKSAISPIQFFFSVLAVCRFRITIYIFSKLYA